MLLYFLKKLISFYQLARKCFLTRGQSFLPSWTGLSTCLCWDPSYARTHASLLCIKIFFSFFLFLFCLFALKNIPHPNCTTIGCNISRKHKLALFQTHTNNFIFDKKMGMVYIHMVHIHMLSSAALINKTQW